jgi:hypothetical protein
MQETTVLMPKELKHALGPVAAMRGSSEAELIRAPTRSDA